MTNSVTDILVTELGKITDTIVPYCIIIAIVLVVLGLVIGSIKNFFRNIFK